MILLLTVICIGYVGLGIPDSLFGAAWPAIYTGFGVPFSLAGAVSVTISAMTTLSGLMSARVVARLGTRRVAVLSTFLTAAALIGYSFAPDMRFIILLSVPLGLGAGGIDSALNNYVALNFKAWHMSLLHAFYGVGVTAGPYIMGLLISGADGWRGGYRAAFFIQLCITAVLIASRPLWKKNGSAGGGTEPQETRVVPLKELAAMPKVRAAWFMLIGSCAVEVTCGNWGATYLVEHRGLAPDKAASLITFYYLGMTLGRLASALVTRRISSRTVITAGEAVVFAAITALLLPLPLPLPACIAAMFFIGFGNGPLFPNMSHLTPQVFGREISQSVMGTLMAAASLGIMTLPPLFGLLAQALGTGIFAWYLLAMFAILLVSTARMRYLERKT